MKTVKSWKIDRTAFTENWLEKVAYPAIERLMNKGKTHITFVGLSDKLDKDFIVEQIRGYYLNPKYNERTNELVVDWSAQELDFQTVYNVLSR